MSNIDSNKQRCQYFRPAYKSEFPEIKESQVGNTYAFCVYCASDFVISHGGRSDIKRHLDTNKHKANVLKQEKNSRMTTFFQKAESDDVSVIRAECLFTKFLVEHNISLSTADHAGPLLRKMFPDSDIAKKYSCARTKTSAIIDKMAVVHQKDLIANLKKSVFSVATDGSNDSDTKLYPIVVTYFNDSLQKITVSLLSLPTLTIDATGENIANLILNELDRLEIPISNMIAFSADNAFVMTGNKKGVFTFLQKNKTN